MYIEDTKKMFKRCGDNVKFFEFTKFIGHENIEIGDNVIIDDFCLIHAAKRHIIGNFVHIASFTSITGGGEFIIEDFAGISSGCRILTGTEDFLGGSLTNPTIPVEFRKVQRSIVVIKKHAIIGANSIIFPGITIGEGVAVGAGSIINKDIEPWGVYMGTKRIKERPKDVILQMEQELLKKIAENPQITNFITKLESKK